MEAIRNLAPQGLPVTLQVIGATILLSIAYSFFTKDRPWPAFPLITVRGLGAKKSWMVYGHEVLDEGLSKVYLSRQLLNN
jgi:hypothetical protein